jgi:hypothetical protein
VGVLSCAAAGAEFNFTPIDTIAGPGGGFDLAGINDAGTVAYARNTPGQTPTGGTNGIYVAQGGTIRPVFERAALGSTPLQLAVNEQSRVLFHWREGTVETLYVGGATPSPAVTPVADTSGPFAAFGTFLHPPILDNSGRPVFNARLDDNSVGIFTGGNPVADKFVNTGSSLQFVRDDGTIIFRTIRSNGSGFYKGTDPVADLVLDLGTTFGNASNYEENAGGGRIFSATFNDGTGQRVGIFTGTDPVADRFADTSSAYQSFRVAELNDRGTITFLADLNGGGRGIFVGPDPVADKVIGIGDPLFGSTVTALGLNQGSLNDRDQVAFTYGLANGQSGVAVVTVPEPVGGVLLAVGAVVGWGRRRARRQLLR